MAALKNAVLNSWDDSSAVNVAGSWSSMTSSHANAVYTSMPFHSFNYIGSNPFGSIGSYVQEDIRVYPRVPRERTYP